MAASRTASVPHASPSGHASAGPHLPAPSGPSGLITDAVLREVKPQSRTAFLKAFMKAPVQLGTCFSSSPALCRRMTAQLNLGEASVVFELGSGTGPLTAAVLRQVRPGCRFFAVEMNHELAEGLRRRFPGVSILETDATKLRDLCRHEDVAPGAVDAICASLPYMLFPKTLQREALEDMHAVLRPGGRMVMLTYWPEEIHPRARAWRKMLDATFRVVKRHSVVWANLPPAFVYLVEK